MKLMPRNVNSKSLLAYRKKHRNQLPSPGFTIIEVLIALIFIAMIVTITLSTGLNFNRILRFNLQSAAVKIASGELETLRTKSFAEIEALPSSGNVLDPDLTKLPQSTATRAVADFEGNPDVKSITVTVTWTENNVAKNIKMTTLISRYGL